MKLLIFIHILSTTLLWCNSDLENLVLTMHSSTKPSTIFRLPQIEKPSVLKVDMLKRLQEVKHKELSKPKSMNLKGVPLYSQGVKDPFDPRGLKGKYPQGYCGPTSLQMVLQYYGVKKSRDYLALTNLGSGSMYVPGRGSFYPRMVKMAKYLGFKKSRMYTNRKLESLIQSIQDGRPQIVRFTGRINYLDGTSYKPTTGHIVVVKGIKSDGTFVIHDPGRGRKVRAMKQNQFLKNWNGISVDIQT
ncbi:MAG: C39 family peptidase [Candidatus Cloacimonetes bacterium]|nr:C39 family peptidase [Candidatus Cloacimonadota bacterium]